MKDKCKRGKTVSSVIVHKWLAVEAKAIVAIAFRNGPIEDIHAGDPCPACGGKPQYSHITQEEMKLVMKTAVDRTFTLLALREENPSGYKALMEFTARTYTHSWDEPAFTRDL